MKVRTRLTIIDRTIDQVTAMSDVMTIMVTAIAAVSVPYVLLLLWLSRHN